MTYNNLRKYRIEMGMVHPLAAAHGTMCVETYTAQRYFAVMNGWEADLPDGDAALFTGSMTFNPQ